MKKIVLLSALLIANSSFAKTASYVCTVVKNTSKTALVAGEYFKMTTDDNFGINANFQYPVQVESPYLDLCKGTGTANTHPLAQGYAGMVSIGGSECAADGFDIFISAGVVGVIQVEVESEEVSYSCIKIKNK